MTQRRSWLRMLDGHPLLGWTRHRALPFTNASLKRAPFRLAERQTSRLARSLDATAARSPHLNGRGRSIALSERPLAMHVGRSTDYALSSFLNAESSSASDEAEGLKRRPWRCLPRMS